MTSKKQKKGKTMALTDFLNADSKLVTVRANWSEIVDNADEEPKPIVVDIGILPTAPRGAVDIDYSNVPTNPPFVAHIANISFEVDDEGLRRIFADLNPKTARVIREGTRSRGIGLVEFETRENLIDALKRTDKEIYGRRIRINVSDKTETDSGRGSFGNYRSNRGTGGEDRPEMSSTWKRAEPRSDEPSDDRSSGGFNRDRQNRGEHGRSNTGGSSRGNQHGDDFGFGYPRSRDDRGGGAGGSGGGGGGRDYNRQGQRNRYQDDDNRSNSGVDRPRYAGRYSDTRDTRDRNRPNDETPDDQREPPRERQRLQLQPRTKPLEDLQQLSGSSSSINNVAANAEQSTSPNPDDSSSSITNTSNQQIQDSSINEHQQQDSNDNTSRANLPDEQSTVKPSGGAGASIFGGAKPVDTAARELEIERKLQEFQITTHETSVDNEEKKPSSWSSYNRGQRSSQNDDHRDRRDDGRSGHSGDYHHKREYSGGRQYEDDGRKRNDDDHQPRRGGGYDRARYNGPSRRDQDSNRTGKYNPPERDNERSNYRNRNQDTNESNNQGRSSNNNFNSDTQLRQPPRGMVRRTVQTEDETNKLQLSNKFGMLDADDDLDHNNETDDAQSPSIDD